MESVVPGDGLHLDGGVVLGFSLGLRSRGALFLVRRARGLDRHFLAVVLAVPPAGRQRRGTPALRILVADDRRALLDLLALGLGAQQGLDLIVAVGDLDAEQLAVVVRAGAAELAGVQADVDGDVLGEVVAGVAKEAAARLVAGGAAVGVVLEVVEGPGFLGGGGTGGEFVGARGEADGFGRGRGGG